MIFFVDIGNDECVCINGCTEIPTIIDPSATKNHPSATGSIIVGISVCVHVYLHTHVLRQAHMCVCVCVCVCVRVCVCIDTQQKEHVRRTYTYIITRLHIHAYIHTYIHT
jgi:hypothetical protein